MSQMSYSNENSKAEREKAWESEWRRKAWNVELVGQAVCCLQFFRFIIQAFCNCLGNLPRQGSFEGAWITGEGTENLVFCMVGDCVLFFRITCSSTAYAAFVPAPWAIVFFAWLVVHFPPPSHPGGSWVYCCRQREHLLLFSSAHFFIRFLAILYNINLPQSTGLLTMA